MAALLLAIFVCATLGLLCAIANRTMFVIKKTETRTHPAFGIAVLFIVLCVSIMFLTVIDYQYSNFLRWVLDRFIGSAFILVLSRTVIFTIFIFGVFLVLNAIYKQIDWINKKENAKYELFISTAIYTLSYFLFNAYLFKPFVRFLIKTYIKF